MIKEKKRAKERERAKEKTRGKAKRKKSNRVKLNFNWGKTCSIYKGTLMCER